MWVPTRPGRKLFRGDRLREGRNERGSLFYPPSPASVEALHASHVVPHPHETGITGLDPTPDELATAGDRIRQDREQFAAGRAVEAVGVGRETQAGGSIRDRRERVVGLRPRRIRRKGNVGPR
jgi:hypothetical protein